MRLTGLALLAARRFAESPGGAHILRQKVFHDYKIDELLALPPGARAPLSVHRGPMAQNRRRGWSSADLGVPDAAPHRTTSADLRQAYRAGHISPVEVLETLRQRIENEDFGQAHFSPFRYLDIERAKKSAKASEQRYQQGTTLGPLDGIPVPLKDQHDMEGLPTGAGTAYREDTADKDAHLTRVLRDGGALLYAKTHTTEWGMSPCGFCPHLSLPRNVYSDQFSAGGSSTGAAVAAALGFAPVASGSDGGGSIRIPAAMNGLFGIKPTFVRIGRSGDIFGSSSVSAVGPLGVSTADLVDFLSVACATDDRDDPTRRWGPRQRNLDQRWRRALGRGVKGCRIGIAHSEWEDLDDPLYQPTMDALQRLERDGATLVDIEVPLIGHAPAIGVLSIGLETLANLDDDYRHHADAFSDELRMTMAMLRTISAPEFLAAQRTRAALRAALRDVLDDVDLIALPTTRTTASEYPPILDGVPMTDDEAIRSMTRFTFLANITGLPAGSVPVGRHRDLAFGLQFIGGAWDEASVLAAMAHCERQQWTHLAAPQSHRAF